MLKLDYANCLSDRIGFHGLDPARIDPNNEPAQGMAAFTKKLASTRGTGWEVWRDLPFPPAKDQYVSATKDIASRYEGKVNNLVVLGIGGSALGNIALQNALNPSTYNLTSNEKRRTPRLFVLDNVDPAFFSSTLSFILDDDPTLERTLFNVISKSGETAETAAQFMIIRDLLNSKLGDRAKDHIVAITDANKGTMRTICDAEGYATLPVPDGVGGRFSVLSPVGLFSAHMTGIDIDALLDGAADMDAACSQENMQDNPAAMLAFLLIELGTRKGKTNHVLMPYCNALYSMADWFRQLWAESLGKKQDLQGETVYTGMTPIKALGATDQHSQVQLYREGPNDKVIGLIDVVDQAGDVDIPTGMNVDAIKYLEGSTLGKLLAAEKRATEYALVESQRPNFTITFPTLDAYHVGQFIAMWEIATSYAGLLLNIDAYDQPAVELGKQATFGLMGRAGYERFLQQVNETLTDAKRSIGG